MQNDTASKLLLEIISRDTQQIGELQKRNKELSEEIERLKGMVREWQPIENITGKARHIIVWGSYTRDCPQHSQEAIYYPKGKKFEIRNLDMSRTKNVTHYQEMPNKN